MWTRGFQDHSGTGADPSDSSRCRTVSGREKILLTTLRALRATVTLGGLGTWRSPVAHCNGVAGVAGSNPAVPTDRPFACRMHWGSSGALDTERSRAESSRSIR